MRMVSLEQEMFVLLNNPVSAMYVHTKPMNTIMQNNTIANVPPCLDGGRSAFAPFNSAATPIKPTMFMNKAAKITDALRLQGKEIEIESACLRTSSSAASTNSCFCSLCFICGRSPKECIHIGQVGVVSRAISISFLHAGHVIIDIFPHLFSGL